MFNSKTLTDLVERNSVEAARSLDVDDIERIGRQIMDAYNKFA